MAKRTKGGSKPSPHSKKYQVDDMIAQFDHQPMGWHLFAEPSKSGYSSGIVDGPGSCRYAWYKLLHMAIAWGKWEDDTTGGPSKHYAGVDFSQMSPKQLKVFSEVFRSTVNWAMAAQNYMKEAGGIAPATAPTEPWAAE